MAYVDLFVKLKHFVYTLHHILSKFNEFYTFLIEFSKSYRKKYERFFLEEWQPWWNLFLKSLFSLKWPQLFFYELKDVSFGQQSYSVEIPRNIAVIYPIRLYPLISAHCAPVPLSTGAAPNFTRSTVIGYITTIFLGISTEYDCWR